MKRQVLLGVAVALGTVAIAFAEDAATGPAKPRSIEAFKPSRDGFVFANAFAGLPTRTDWLDRAGQSHGLCGGMSFAAADYFLTRQSIPQSGITPQKGSPMYGYLFQRQIDSISDGYAEKFITWTRMPDTGKDSAASLTVDEATAAKKKLDAHEPAILGLVLVDKPLDVFSNHQVLATGYEEKDKKTIFRTYDPNYPRDDHRVITVEAVLDADGALQAKVKRGKSGGSLTQIRGFFVMGYKPADPQKALAKKTP